MEAQERTEVREMLHDILAGWQATNTAQADMTNLALGEIKEHLMKLNGKVADHEKLINIHLPHSVRNCVQTEVLEDLKKNMISGKAVRNSIILSIGSFASLGLLLTSPLGIAALIAVGTAMTAIALETPKSKKAIDDLYDSFSKTPQQRLADTQRSIDISSNKQGLDPIQQAINSGDKAAMDSILKGQVRYTGGANINNNITFGNPMWAQQTFAPAISNFVKGIGDLGARIFGTKTMTNTGGEINGIYSNY